MSQRIIVRRQISFRTTFARHARSCSRSARHRRPDRCGTTRRGESNTLVRPVSPMKNTTDEKFAALRQKIYADYISLNPSTCRLVALAEPRPTRRSTLAKRHSIPSDLVFKDWKELASRGKVADAVIIAIMDRGHAEAVKVFAEQGYDILCEKPIATSIEECVGIVEAVKKHGVIFGCGHGEFRLRTKSTDRPLLSHIFSAPLLTPSSISSPPPPPSHLFFSLAVLRYSPYNTSIRQTISTGILGKIINIQHLEPVGRQHFAHSYVRGNWRNEKMASFSLMAKSCHDIDILK